jgi:hypothetical protein
VADSSSLVLTPQQCTDTLSKTVFRTSCYVRKWFGQRLLFRQTTGCRITRELSSDSAVSIQRSTIKWPRSCVPVENCSLVWSKPTDKSYKMGDDYHGHGQTTWFPREVGVQPSDIHRRLLQFVEENACTAQCVHFDTGFHSVSKLHRQLSVRDIATLLKNGSKKPSGSSQRDGSDVQPRTGLC